MAKIKEILCMHHSHLDIGYTHPQPLILELQQDYIDQAIDLCLKTADFPEESKFRWTCEATLPVINWMKKASSKRIDQLKECIYNNQISITAMAMHTTPLCNVAQLEYMFKSTVELSKMLDISISTAINHDVNGQPWTMSQLLLDSGVNFYITGINVHFGGIPFKRPSVFMWKTPDKRELLTFVGEQYSMFSQNFKTPMEDTSLMDKGVKDYISRLEQNGYTQDFAFLTATNPPLFDNNPPDMELANLIRKYNAEGHEQVIRFVTPEMLRERVLKINRNEIPVHAGDWTDYWNFGSASSAKETRVNRKAKENLKKAELLEAFSNGQNNHYASLKDEVYLNSIKYDEHTWGAAHSINQPNDEEVYSQRIHKTEMAYKAADLSAYLLGRQVEKLSNNSLQSREPEGVLVVNTSCTNQEIPLWIPKAFSEKGRHLAAARIKHFLPYSKNTDNYQYYGSVKLAPFSWKTIPFTFLEKNKKNIDSTTQKAYSVSENTIETPFYKMTFDPQTGRIMQLIDTINNWSVIDEKSEWTLFEYIRETINPLKNIEQRSTFFSWDNDLFNKRLSHWNHSWEGKREGAEKVVEWHIEQEADEVSYVMEINAPGVKSLKQKLTFSVLHPRLKMKAYMNKEDFTNPEGIYFAFPLNLKSGWKSHFDTAGTFVELDKEQLGTVCRDWITVDQTVSLYDGDKGVVLSCPDAPMVQIGDFNFGKENKCIERNERPLLLAWPMNNYWETNFWASQPGCIELCYELSTFREFRPQDVYDMGQLANEQFIINAVTHCDKEESGVLFEGTGENIVPVSIKPAKNGGITLILKNLSDTECRYSYTVPGKTIARASFVNIAGEELSEINIANGRINADISANALVHIHVSFKDHD